MLTSLSIKNYTLIDDIRVRFGSGLSIITGETGAGKSILLGGLSLILGKRADPGALKNKDEKCVVEAEFAIAAYHLNDFFAAQDIDFDEKTIVRREILPGGKSRAFVNDTPVTLNTLSLLAGKLIDIHSQHETLQLKDDDFQFEIIDAIASNATLLKQ
ncbi:MAG: AAA family ATPase, partial [Sinomicrobium sp.]|nr:AAA family ATPase [Sinomicrobium sp.]